MADEAGTGTTVLVVDDDADICEMLSGVLREEGYQVLEARRGQAALEMLFGAPQPMVVVLDEVMPGMSGSELLTVVRQDARLAQRQDAYILMTASAQRVPEAVHQETRESGMPILAKPFDVTTLLALVGEAAQRVARAGGA